MTVRSESLGATQEPGERALTGGRYGPLEMSVPGPPLLGRGVVVTGDDPVPSAWADAPEVVVDEPALADPAPTVATLHDAWLGRHPVVIRLLVDPERFRAPETVNVEPWRLSPTHEFWADRLHFLVWANTYDARGGDDPVWWWARKAARLGVTEVASGGDVAFDDGSRAWVDGGPRTAFTADELASLGAEVIHRETVELGARHHPSAGAGAGRRAGTRSTGRRGPPRRAGPYRRPGRFGQDPSSHRTTAAPARRLGLRA